jgi:hypothetical protein
MPLEDDRVWAARLVDIVRWLGYELTSNRADQRLFRETTTSARVDLYA